MNYKLLADKICEIAKQAGTLITSTIQLDIIEKDGAVNIVTNMDIASQKLIVEKCLELLPDSSILAEENEENHLGDEFTWVIDPIDGTTNFAYGYHHSCISIALLYKKKGLIGVIYDPYLDECFVGIDSEGSWCNGKEIHVSSNPMTSALCVVGTSPYYKKDYAEQTFKMMKSLFLKGRDIRRSGSAALDLCYVASGKCDVYAELRLSPWDYAAGIIILENAGGKYRVLENKTLSYDSPVGLVASNQKCFEEAIQLVEECYE